MKGKMFAATGLSLAILCGPAPDIAQKAGAKAGTDYVLLSMDGKTIAGATASSPPRLTAQCTRDAAGKLRFELLADFGGVGEVDFYPPWKSTREDPHRPFVPKIKVTMEFLGYTRVKPVKVEWWQLLELAGEMKYAAPGMQAGNLNEIAFYMQYLRALPTLRITLPGTGVAEFQTAKWQAAVKAEPLCWASGL